MMRKVKMIPCSISIKKRQPRDIYFGDDSVLMGSVMLVLCLSSFVSLLYFSGVLFWS